MEQKASSPEPILFIRKLQQNYVNFYKLQAATGQPVEGVAVYSPKEKPILVKELPPGIRAQLQEYKESHPEQVITLLKYMRTVNGKPTLIIEDETDLPSEGQILSISQTITVNTDELIKVITDLLIARRM
jgi:hypothetical protein